MLQGKKVRLRGLELEDVDELMAHWNDWELRRFLNAIVPHSRQEEEDFIRSTWRSRQAGTAFIFGIETIQDKKLIGSMGFSTVDWVNRTADFGIAIWNKQYWDQGLGAEATTLLLKYAFEQLNLNRVELRVFAFNERAKSMYEKVGFKQVGRRRKGIFRDGKYHDEFLMDYLREEWENTTKPD